MKQEKHLWRGLFFGIIVISILLVCVGCGKSNKQFLSIATASTGGTYYPIGTGLGNVWSDKLDHIKATGQSSAGSVENIDLLRNNEAQMAILQGLIGVQAYEGKGIFEGDPYKGLRSMFMLWPNVEHFVLMNGKVKTGTISDIEGHRFSVGPQASGTEQSTLVIMKGVNLTKDNIHPEYLGYDDTVSAMRDGRLDGGSLPAGIPVSAITDMYASGVKATVLEVTDEQLDSINRLYPTWYRFIIPSGTYPGIDQDLETIAQPNFLAVSDTLDEEVVYDVTKATFENLEEVQQIHNSANNISLETALDGLSVPLHTGAYRYFEEVGIDIPDDLVPPEK